MDMPMKKKRTLASQAAARGPLPELPKELLDELVKGPMTAGEVQDLMLAFNKALIERAMGAEMNHHLGYPPGAAKPPEPVRIFVGEAVKKTLPACLCESFTKQDSELVHGRLPVEGSPDGLGQHIAQRQPEQLDGGLVIGEVTARLDDLA